MKTYSVTIPIAGHAIVEVEADDEEAAIEKALEEVTLNNVDEWEALREFNRGNVCYCPQPWEIEAQDLGEVE